MTVSTWSSLVTDRRGHARHEVAILDLADRVVAVVADHDGHVHLLRPDDTVRVIVSPRTTVSSVPGLVLITCPAGRELLLAVCTVTSRPSAWSWLVALAWSRPTTFGHLHVRVGRDDHLERFRLARPQVRRRRGAHDRARIDVVAVVGGDGDVGESGAGQLDLGRADVERRDVGDGGLGARHAHVHRRALLELVTGGRSLREDDAPRARAVLRRRLEREPGLLHDRDRPRTRRGPSRRGPRSSDRPR